MLLSQYLPSRVSASIRDGRYCGWRRCSNFPVSCSFFGSLLDSPFTFSDSPLVGLHPFLLLLFHPELRSAAPFCGSSLSLAVLAGLLPQLTTFNHCFTIVILHFTSTSSHFHMLKANFHQVQPAEHIRRKYSTLDSNLNLQHLPTYGTSDAFPFGRLTCVLSALPTSP